MSGSGTTLAQGGLALPPSIGSTLLDGRTLSNAGLADWVASDLDGYVELAAGSSMAAGLSRR